MAFATLPGISAALQAKALLTVSGRIGRVNNQTTNTYDFTESAFLKLNQSSITTGTSWTPTSVFVGPLLLDVMQTAGVTDGTLTLKTLDDYSAPIPWEDLVRYGVILAHSQNGKRLTDRHRHQQRRRRGRERQQHHQEQQRLAHAVLEHRRQREKMHIGTH